MITKLRKHSDNEPKLSQSYDWLEVESKVRSFYDVVDTRAMIDKRFPGKKRIGWVEGPPTLNGLPHIGHVRTRVIKDTHYRYFTMKGENIVFRGGWDTQGLPVELQAEKELGLTGNKWENLQKVGIEKMVEACKALVLKYRKDWTESDRLLGLSMDQERAYMTYRDTYIEREWTYLETAWETGLLGEGFKVVPYCPSCQTSLSHAELALGGYELLEDPSLYYKVRTEDGSYLVVWTTMPFTVVTDEMVGTKPDADYEYVKLGEETWVIGSDRKEALQAVMGVKFGKVLRKVKGKDMQGTKYSHPLLELIPGLQKLASQGKIHRVLSEDFVDTSTGTGLVHLAPANGEDDFAVAMKMGLAVFAPFDDRVVFTEEAGRFAGMFARDADQVVVEELRRAGALVHAGRLTHEYPVCWRSGHRLVWLARREYFYWIDRVREKLVKAAEKVEYYFDAPRNRFLESIRDSPPWCVTRERIWGTPLPIWVCASCGAKEAFFSRSKIVAAASELPDGPNFELHRPWIDRVKIPCKSCGKEMRRELFVLDTWHNSGSAPYASFTDKEYKELVPTGFQTEGIDQTRAWAYTLLVLHVLKTGKPLAPYKAFLFQGHVLDEKGRKMSKSLGNTISGFELLRDKSVDLSRFYLIWKSSPPDPLTMDMKEMNARPYQVLNTLYHLHLYLRQNGDVDGYDPRKHTVTWAAEGKLLTAIDEWLLSKLRTTEDVAEKAYEEARYNDACKALEEMVIGHLSQNYVRLVRGELWRDDAEQKRRRLAIYSVMGHALRFLDQLLHPIAPFVTEYLYQQMFTNGQVWKVPLVVRGFEAEKSPPLRKNSEETVELALAVEEACNSARMKARMKRRWPLKSAIVLLFGSSLVAARRAKPIMESLCNVRDVSVVSKPEDFPASFALVPNTSKIGALFKARTREVMAVLGPVGGREALATYLGGKPLAIKTKSGDVEVPLSAFELQMTPEPDYEVAERGGMFVAVDKRRDEKLVAEGLVRDVARRLQALRKTKGFLPTEVLSKASVAGLDREDLELLEPLLESLAFLVRVKKVALSEDQPRGAGWSEEDLDGKPIFLDVH